jgi:CDGSH-type Zn-finger protein/uncharacterized Fe-S cluster protein YjdI
MAAKTIQSREQLLFGLCEAAELEHNLMCTYLYAAFSLKTRDDRGLSVEEAEAVERWRAAILRVAVEEMGHLTAVWNITSALGGSPPFGRDNFPLSPGRLPAGIVVKLAPFGHEALQHFIYLERPTTSHESEGMGFEPEIQFRRGARSPRVTPMPIDYQTVGEFYLDLEGNLRAFAEHHGEAETFCGDRSLQLSSNETSLKGADPVICLKTASAALKYIVEQGEGAPEHSANSHFSRFMAIRDELDNLKKKNPNFEPAFPAATNPLLRLPVRPEGRIWIENEAAAGVVDAANAGYALMLRLLAYSYVVPSPEPEKSLAVDLALGLMRAVTCLAERAARLPIGPTHPICNAGVTFSALRDASTLPRGPAARRLFVERFSEILDGAEKISGDGDARTSQAVRLLSDLNKRALRGFTRVTSASPKKSEADFQKTKLDGSAKDPDPRASPAPTSHVEGAVEYIEGKDLTLIYEGKKCIHARFCVTGAPDVFLANVVGPWIKPDAIDADSLVEIAHACPSGAIRYKRKDGKHDESAPPVNLIAVRESGPYAVRADIHLDDYASFYRATLCRCGASKNKPFCDGSHHEVAFSATGEPPTGSTDMLPVRNGVLSIEPQTDGPLQVRGNLEIVSGTGRVVARLTQARLCRCGGSATKPFCDGTHARIGFKSS